LLADVIFLDYDALHSILAWLCPDQAGGAHNTPPDLMLDI